MVIYYFIFKYLKFAFNFNDLYALQALSQCEAALDKLLITRVNADSTAAAAQVNIR